MPIVASKSNSVSLQCGKLSARSRRSGLRFSHKTICRIQPAMPRLIPLAACIAPPTPANPSLLTRGTQALAAAAQFALRAQPTRRLRRGCISRPSARTERQAAQPKAEPRRKERKKRTYLKVRKRREGLSAELSDTRRRGSSHARRSTPRGEEAVSGRRCIAARNAAEATGAATRGAGARPRPVAGATNTRDAMGGKFRRRQPGTPKPVAAGCAGLRPDGVYAYAERSHGRAGRPRGTGRTVATKLAAR